MRAVMHRGDDIACAHIKMPESGFATLENGQLPQLHRQIGTAGSSGFLLGLRSTISPEGKRHPSYIGGPPLYMIRRRNEQIPDVMGSRYAVSLLYGVQKRINFLKRKTDSEPNMKRRSCRKSVIWTDTRPQLGTRTEARKLRFFSLGRKELMSCWIHLSKFGIAARPGHVRISKSIQPREVIPGICHVIFACF